MKNYFLVELQDFFKNKKNRVVFVLLLIFGLYYAFILSDNYDPIQKVNSKQIESRYTNQKHFLDTTTVTEHTHPAVQYAVMIFSEWSEIDSVRLESLKNNNLREYAKYTALWYTYSDCIYFAPPYESLHYDLPYFQSNNPYGYLDGHYAYKKEAVRYQGFSEADYPLSINAFEERTALQTFYRLSLDLLPLVVFIALIFLAADLISKDKYHSSLLTGFPITPLQRILAKFFVGIVGIFTILLSFVPAFIVLSIKNGFGNLNYPIPIYINNFMNNGHFVNITLGEYLVKFFSFLLIWCSFLLSLMLLIHTLFQKDILTIFLMFLLVFAETFYYSRGVGEYSSFEWLPSSYIKIGEIISGYHNYLYGSSKFSEPQMLLVLCPLIIVIFLGHYWITSRKGRLN